MWRVTAKRMRSTLLGIMTMKMHRLSLTLQITQISSRGKKVGFACIDTVLRHDSFRQSSGDIY